MLNSLGLNKPPRETRVCVAMSGGVDSSAAVVLLQKEGYDVFGLTMDLLQPPYAPQSSSITDAGKVAHQLGIEHHYLDLKSEFQQNVVQYFASSYQQGLTPSPCIMCNKYIKLGLLADQAQKHGADLLVTGHYAEIKMTENGVELHRAADLSRDQSYFLFAVSKQTLQMLRCPLAGMSKDQTREIARSAGLEIYQKADSQDICFVSEGKYAELIEYINPQSSTPGKIVHRDGRVLGEHKGLIHYTVGQRRGLGIGGDIGILYVLELDAAQNRLIVGSYEDLSHTKVLLEDINWLAEPHPEIMDIEVKLRSRQKIVPATVKFTDSQTAELTLHQKFYGTAPGQGCCFYSGSRILGGGFIVSSPD